MLSWFLDTHCLGTMHLPMQTLLFLIVCLSVCLSILIHLQFYLHSFCVGSGRMTSCTDEMDPHAYTLVYMCLCDCGGGGGGGGVCVCVCVCGGGGGGGVVG